MAQYKVVGPRTVAGVEPGGVVEFHPEEADWLIEAGHLAPIATQKSKAKAPAKAVENQSDSEPSEGGEQ